MNYGGERFRSPRPSDPARQANLILIVKYNRRTLLGGFVLIADHSFFMPEISLVKELSEEEEIAKEIDEDVKARRSRRRARRRKIHWHIEI